MFFKSQFQITGPVFLESGVSPRIESVSGPASPRSATLNLTLNQKKKNWRRHSKYVVNLISVLNTLLACVMGFEQNVKKISG